MSETEVVKEKTGNTGPVATDHEQSLAKAALTDFKKKNYASALGNLKALEATWAQDYKVVHNKAVVEYYLSGLKETEQFQKKLNDVRQPSYNNEDCTEPDYAEHCALYYNHAVLLFHNKKYSLALNIIKQVFKFIEPMGRVFDIQTKKRLNNFARSLFRNKLLQRFQGVVYTKAQTALCLAFSWLEFQMPLDIESLAHKVCLLLLELLLCLRRVDEALEHVNYITLQFASTKNIQMLEEPAEKKPLIFDAATDAFRRKLLMYKTRCYLMSGNAVGAARELQVIDSLGCGQSQGALFLSAQIESIHGRLEKSFEILKAAEKADNRSFMECGISVPICFNNNMGYLYHEFGKHNFSRFFFRQALLEHERILKNVTGSPSRPLFTLNNNNIAQLLYNAGVSELFANRPAQAFDILLLTVQVYHLNPRLWLRMAECGIRAHKEGNEEEFAMFAQQKDIVGSVFGSGGHRKLCLANQTPFVKSGSGVSAAIPAPTLEFSALCLKNVLMLLPPGVEGERRDTWVSPPSTPTPIKREKKPSARCSMFGAPSILLSDSELQALRVSALTASAYVALCLGDYIMALEHSETLLRERLPGAHRTLAHLYAAEAMTMLNLTSEAIEHLNPEYVLDLEVSLPSLGTDSSTTQPKSKRDWYPDKALVGQMVMQFNMAAAFAIRGELERAGELLKFIWSIKMKADIPLKIVMLALYIELQLGHTENAKSILKQHFPLL